MSPGRPIKIDFLTLSETNRPLSGWERSRCVLHVKWILINSGCCLLMKLQESAVRSVGRSVGLRKERLSPLGCPELSQYFLLSSASARASPNLVLAVVLENRTDRCYQMARTGLLFCLLIVMPTRKEPKGSGLMWISSFFLDLHGLNKIRKLNFAWLWVVLLFHSF